MGIDGLNKILLILFILSILNVVRHTFFVVRFYMNDKRFSLGRTSLILLGLSISYIVVGIIEGIKI